MKKGIEKNRGGATLPIILAVLVLIVVGVFIYGNNFSENQTENETQMTETEMQEKNIESDTEEGAMSEGESMLGGSMDGGLTMDIKFSGEVLAGESAPLLDFNKTDYDRALIEGKSILLYFYANWCPICREEFPIAQSAFNELVRRDVVGFRVNYKDSDTDSDEEALAREFGVAYQHTKVIINDGERIGKYPDSWDKDRYLLEISKI